MGHAVQVCREVEYQDALQVLSNFISFYLNVYLKKSFFFLSKNLRAINVTLSIKEMLFLPQVK